MDPPDDNPSKSQVVDDAPKRIAALQFGLLSPQDIVAQSVLAVTDRHLYDQNTEPGQRRVPTKSGPIDTKLGTSSKTEWCATCGRGLKDCNGHFGHVRLALPCLHYGYVKKIAEVLNCVCKDCSRILLPEQERRRALKAVRRPGLDRLRRGVLDKKVVADCKKIKQCSRCGGWNGAVKKVGGHPVKLVHNKYAKYTSSNAKSKQKPEEMIKWEESFEEAKKTNQDVDRNLKRATDDMHPLRILKIFRKIPPMDVELLGMDPHEGGRPEHMVWTHIPAPPVAIRPSVAQDNASTEDDITNKLGDIVDMNNLLRATLTKGQPLNKVMEIWEFVQVQCAMLVDGNLPGLALGRDSMFGRQLRGFVQRLKGKQGRFRGNLSGKRVDFSGRTVISPDPNLGINEVAVPARVAMNMTYPEKVTNYNFDKLKACIQRGDKQHPGANFIIKGGDGRRIVLRMVGQRGDLNKLADRLEIGDTVERHLEDGDIVLFNRQPSLHKLSILSHKVKVRPWRTFRLNECVCNPYNADFDGDEMNLHVPQTEEARTEAIELMGVKHNLATPKNGTPIIAAIQDFITGAYLISQKDRFFSRGEFMQVVTWMYDGLEVRDPHAGKTHPVQIPSPAIVKPMQLWTGKQVWDVLMRPHKDYPVEVNLEAKGKQFTAPELKDVYAQRLLDPDGELRNDELNPMLGRTAKKKVKDNFRGLKKLIKSRTLEADLSLNDSYLVVRNSEVMCGALDKAMIGDGKKASIFYVILRDFGPDYAVAAMNRLAKLSARWLTEQGFSIGISDVYPSQLLSDKKDALVKKAYQECTDLIQQFNEGRLKPQPGYDMELTLESEITGILSKVRQACGNACFAELSPLNAPLTMAKCGSKGSDINVAQMVAAVGQQVIGGARVVDGFEGRTLPHFPKKSRDPPAKGFVVNSFFSGLNPTEFLFHAMSGREGLVDTAVKTAETGYMSRRLMKSLEDLSAQYDQTVRDSSGGVVQMKFGDDGLDPVDMEGSAQPVDFNRTFVHAVSSTWDNSERGLLPEEIEEFLQEEIAKEKLGLIRLGARNTKANDVDRSDASVERFLGTIATFIAERVTRLVSHRTKLPGSDHIFKLSRSALMRFLTLCIRKFEKSKVEPGHAVGAVGAQSIGEPGTQMTLKTFHFAGVAGMSITQGVPRIKEIINASRAISTPVISCALVSKYEEVAARLVKAGIEKCFLGDVVVYIEDVWSVDSSYINMRVDWVQVERLGLRLGQQDITRAIEKTKGMKGLGVVATAWGHSHIRVFIDSDQADWGKKKRAAAKRGKAVEVERENELSFMTMQALKRRLPSVVVKGYSEANRAVMKKDDKKDEQGREPISVWVEGYGLRQCMNTDGVDGERTTTNSVMETRDVLGIEAARNTIINEIGAVMKGMDIDPRHMQLLADVMTYKGEVLGITRFGLAKMRDSVLQLASFEKTADHLFQAAVAGKRDEVKGVSECIIMGRSVGLGTGGMRVVRPLNVAPSQGLKRDAVGVRYEARMEGKERKERLKQLRAGLADVEADGDVPESVPDTFGQFVPLAA